MRATVFWRAYNKDKVKRLSAINVRSLDVEVPTNASLLEIVAAASRVYGGDLWAKQGMGPFEVQTDEGCWYNDEKPLRPTATFTRWD